jgi:hypothetical protein
MCELNRCVLTLFFAACFINSLVAAAGIPGDNVKAASIKPNGDHNGRSSSDSTSQRRHYAEQPFPPFVELLRERSDLILGAVDMLVKDVYRTFDVPEDVLRDVETLQTLDRRRSQLTVEDTCDRCTVCSQLHIKHRACRIHVNYYHFWEQTCSFLRTACCVVTV